MLLFLDVVTPSRDLLKHSRLDYSSSTVVTLN